MHEDRNSEAIELLEKEKIQRPAERTQILLASAYANRAGIKVDKFWGFLVGFDNLLKSSKFFAGTDLGADTKEVLEDLPVEIRTAMKGINVNLRDLQKIRTRLEQIPIVNEDQQKDVLLAIDSLETTKTSGARLYRAILELIMLRTAAENGYQLFVEISKKPKLDCNENITQALNWIEYTNNIFQNLLADVLVAFPTQEKEIARMQVQSVDLLKNLAAESKKAKGLLCKE